MFRESGEDKVILVGFAYSRVKFGLGFWFGCGYF